MVTSPFPSPAAWLVLDVETNAGKPQDIDAEFRLSWTPNPTWKDDTIARRFREAWAKQQERGALCATASIVVIGCQTPSELVSFHCLRAEPRREFPGGALVFGYADGPAMLGAFKEFLEARTTPETVLAGHNIAGFDLPRLRLAILRCGLRLPAALASDSQPLVDTMKIFGRRFYGSNDLFISLREACELVGIETHKDLCAGAQVGELIASGQFDAVISYNLLDTRLEAELFKRLTGRL